MNAIMPIDFATDASRWTALRARDPSADGHFYVAIATTRVYCRPSCNSRPARPENVRFFATRTEAERAGFRPCRRCRPDLPPRAERDAALVRAACRMIETEANEPSLDRLAAAAGVSVFQLHRAFRRVTGVTPKAYASAHRTGRVRAGLAAGGRVTDTIYDAGFNSSGRFYETTDAMLGMTPSAFRAGGAGETIRYAAGQSSLGTVLIAATERGICAILMGDDSGPLETELRRRFPRAHLVSADPAFQATVAQVVAFVDRPDDSARFPLPLDIRGTAFQRRVWEALRAIPAGATASYGEIAARLDAPQAARAVAAACAANPLAVAIPCHRVIGADGGVSGYRWGVERKRRLLARERT